ncbi:hypothetical protein ACFOLC_15090 [Lysobacter cavernae]|uniref:Plug domain-containing protein n=1 Tax=Lysobacter cavernae TaxID=1685901 RepID=A0ABV7RRV5_9GAMM
MPVVVHAARRDRRPFALSLAALCLCAGALQAQEPTAVPAEQDRFSDQRLIVIRQVQPRVAYRPVPVEDHPIQAQATTFPGEVFHDTLGQSIGLLVGDDALGERGSAGVNADPATPAALDRSLSLLGAQPMAGAGTARGPSAMPGASIGGAVSGATRNLGSTITRSLAPVMGATQGRGP